MAQRGVKFFQCLLVIGEEFKSSRSAVEFKAGCPRLVLSRDDIDLDEGSGLAFTYPPVVVAQNLGQSLTAGEHQRDTAQNSAFARPVLAEQKGPRSCLAVGLLEAHVERGNRANIFES